MFEHSCLAVSDREQEGFTPILEINSSKSEIIQALSLSIWAETSGNIFFMVLYFHEQLAQ